MIVSIFPCTYLSEVQSFLRKVKLLPIYRLAIVYVRINAMFLIASLEILINFNYLFFVYDGCYIYNILNQKY